MIRFTALAAAAAVVGGTFGGGAAASAAPSPTSSAVDDSSGCPAGHLPTYVEGAPTDYRPGNPTGVWIWHTPKGYALRVTHPRNGKSLEFAGTITASAPIQVTGVALEKSDHFWLSHDHKTLTFAFENFGATDGLDFRADCARLVTFRLSVGDAHRLQLLSPARVHLGVHGVTPPSNPFTLQRRR
ncbi:MAG: hypothetical protein IRZ02_06275 [Acidothermus sp.]|nr:hypothetical protein [Acidothermus sp.]